MTDVLALLLENELVQRFGWGLLHSLWQIAVLAGLYYLARLAIPKRFLQVRYHLGYSVLLLMLVLPVATAMLMPLPDFSQANVVALQSRDGDGAVEKNVEFEVGGLELKETETQNHSKLDMTALSGDSFFSDARTQGGAVSMAEFIDLVGEDAVAQAFLEAEGNIPSRDGDGVVEESVAFGVEGLELKETNTQNHSTLNTPNSKLHTVLQYLWVLTFAWLIGVIFLSTRLTCGLFGIGRLRRSARPPVDDEWLDRLAGLCRSLQVRQNVQLLVSRAVDSPVLIGMFRPAILVPLSFLSGFTPEEVEAILVHELAHVRRHDYLANLMQLVIETLLFYHPMLWFVSNAVREDREYICDEFVVRHGTDSVFYAKTLTNLEQFRQTGGNNMKQTLYTPAAAARPLLNRVRHILGLKQESDRTCGGMAGLTLLIVLMLSPLCFALLQEGEQSVELGVGSLELTSDSELQASEVENSLQEDNSTLQTQHSTLPANPEQGDTHNAAISPMTTPVATGESEPVTSKRYEFPDRFPPVATGESEPVTSKLYSVENALQLFEMEMLHNYLRQRIVTIAARDQGRYVQNPFSINPTKRNALLVTGTERVHDEMRKIMAEIDAIVDSEEFLNSREMNAAEKPEIKVFKIKHTAAPSLMTIFQSLQIDPQMLLSADMPTNSVLVKATPETLEIVEGLITKLDTEPEPNRVTNRGNYFYQGGGYAANPPTQLFPSYPTAPGQSAQLQQQYQMAPGQPATPQFGLTMQAVPNLPMYSDGSSQYIQAIPPATRQPAEAQERVSPQQPVPAQPRTSVPATPSSSNLPVVEPDPNVQFMNATPGQTRAVPASASDSVMVQQAANSPAEGESPVRAIYRARPETGRSGTGVPSETNPRSATPKTVTITRKVEETTPEGETIEREVTEEVSVEEALVDSHPVAAEPI